MYKIKKKKTHRGGRIDARMHYCTFNKLILNEEVETKYSKKRVYKKMTNKIKKRFYSKNIVLMLPKNYKGVVNLSKTIFANIENNLEITSQKLNKIVKSELIKSKISTHRVLVYGEEIINNTNVNYVSPITSTTMHENQCFDTKKKLGDEEANIVTIPTNVKIPEGEIRNVSSNIYKFPFIKENQNKIIPKEESKYILEMRNKVLEKLPYKNTQLISDLNGKTFKILNDHINMKNWKMVYIDGDKAVKLTAKDQSIYNYNVLMDDKIRDFYNQKVTEVQMKKVIEEYVKNSKD